MMSGETYAPHLRQVRRCSFLYQLVTDWSSMRRNDITSYEEQQRSDEAAIECEAVTVDVRDNACRSITRRSVVKGAAAAVFALATVPLWRWVTSPVRAYADESSDAILAQAKELRNQLIAAQSQYYEAIARQEAANTQKADAEAKLAEIEEQLSGEQDKLGRLMHGNYVGSSRFEQIASIVTKSSDLDEMIEGLTYYNNLTDRQTDAVNSVKELQRQQEETIAEIERQAEEAAKQAEEASQKEEELQAKIAELQPQINEIAAQVSEEALGSSLYSAYEPIITYLTSVQDLTENQQKIIKSALQQTGYRGASLCESWTWNCVHNAGFTTPSYPSAYASFLANCKTTDLNDARPAALVWASGSSTLYNHTGIVVSVGYYDDGVTVDPDKLLIVDNESHNRSGMYNLTEWESWMTSGPHNGGKKGFWGFGQYPGASIGY